MARKENEPFKGPGYGEDYELLPHRDIVELREELRKLRVQPSEKTLQISMVELATKIDRLIDIFEEAKEMIKVEEGALTFQEKIRPLIMRVEKVLEQNSQIAEGVVAIADMVNELKEIVGGKPSRPSFPERPFPLLEQPGSGRMPLLPESMPPPPPIE